MGDVSGHTFHLPEWMALTVGLVKAEHPSPWNVLESGTWSLRVVLRQSQNLGPLTSNSTVRNCAKCFDSWMGQ